MSATLSSRQSIRRAVALVGVAGSLALLPGSAQAGFFEQLFGMQPAPEVQQPAVASPDVQFAPRRVHRAPVRRKVATAVVTDGRQTPTDLMHDKTLHRGDAVMMKDGLHVYRGSAQGTHEAHDFVPLDESGLPRKERLTLAAVDTTRASVADKDAGAPGSLASGRSAAVSAPISEGTMVTDPRGSKVRYVGP